MTQTRFERAAALHRDGAHEAAVALCLDILREAPDHAEALHLSGLLAWRNIWRGTGWPTCFSIRGRSMPTRRPAMRCGQGCRC